MALDIRETTFGSFDGCTSVLGIIAAVGVTHQHALLLAAVGLAVSSGVGMAGGEWLSDNGKSRTAAVTIGAATSLGTVLPVIPFLLLSGTVALIVGILTVLAIGAAISVARGNAAKDWAQTFLILALASGASVLTALLLGAAG
jgi:hypothetical protein